ncbi:MAG TPA: hypothetical protein VM427_08340 [Patescibacteria group bacterium]|nr:hypothetical protein [Patescibacteria group bacterium]
MLRRPNSAPRRGPLLAAIAVAVVALVLAGCDASIAPSTPRPSRLVATPAPRPTATPTEIDEAPTPRPMPSGGIDLVAAADALADLGSYRVSVVSHGLVPASTASGEVAMTSTLVQGSDPAAAFTMTGVDGLEGGRLQAIVIGEEAWVKSGSGRWLRSPGGAADFDAAFTTLSPIGLVSGFEGLALAINRVGEERRNGQPATHYVSQDGDDAAAAAGLTHGVTNLWIAVDGGYLLGLAVDGTWDLDGKPTPISLTIDVSNVNDPANRVLPPG